MTFLKNIRILAARLLRQTSSVQDIAEKVGYSDSAYFSRVFKSAYGASPEAWRRSRSSGGI
ncbi:MAG: helix-turn-helix domain-containing protein [Merdibacter sp.]